MAQNAPRTHHPSRPPRFGLRVPVTLFLDEVVVRGLTRNLSHGGAFLVLDDVGAMGDPERLVGQALALSIEFPPPWNDVFCEAEVRWFDPGGVGVLFRGMGEPDRRSLAALLASRAHQ